MGGTCGVRAAGIAAVVCTCTSHSSGMLGTTVVAQPCAPDGLPFEVSGRLAWWAPAPFVGGTAAAGERTKAGRCGVTAEQQGGSTGGGGGGGGSRHLCRPQSPHRWLQPFMTECSDARGG